MDNIYPTPPTCPTCHQPILKEWYFCANCGRELNPKPIDVSIMKQIGIYATSVFLPPFGFWPGIKYLEKPGKKAKIVGTIAIILTIISLSASVYLTIKFLQGSFSAYNGLLNGSGGLNGLY